MVMLIAPVEVTRPQGWLRLQTQIGAAARRRIPHRRRGRFPVGGISSAGRSCPGPAASHVCSLQPWHHLGFCEDKGVLCPKALPASGNPIGTQRWIGWNGIFFGRVDNLRAKAKSGARAELLSQRVLPGVGFWGMKRSAFVLVWG